MVLASDRAGSSSPLTGLGASLSTTAFAYGIMELGKAINQAQSQSEIDQALDGYDELAMGYVQKWLGTSGFVKDLLAKQLWKNHE
jgi:hypothetical protein